MVTMLVINTVALNENVRFDFCLYLRNALRFKAHSTIMLFNIQLSVCDNNSENDE
jgi:hypothetical protein